MISYFNLKHRLFCVFSFFMIMMCFQNFVYSANFCLFGRSSGKEGQPKKPSIWVRYIGRPRAKGKTDSKVQPPKPAEQKKTNNEKNVEEDAKDKKIAEQKAEIEKLERQLQISKTNARKVIEDLENEMAALDAEIERLNDIVSQQQALLREMSALAPALTKSVDSFIQEGQQIIADHYKRRDQ
jgi:uncharacterized coiled-coil protein SlyX